MKVLQAKLNINNKWKSQENTYLFGKFLQWLKKGLILGSQRYSRVAETPNHDVSFRDRCYWWFHNYSFQCSICILLQRSSKSLNESSNDFVFSISGETNVQRSAGIWKHLKQIKISQLFINSNSCIEWNENFHSSTSSIKYLWFSKLNRIFFPLHEKSAQNIVISRI